LLKLSLVVGWYTFLGTRVYRQKSRHTNVPKQQEALRSVTGRNGTLWSRYNYTIQLQWHRSTLEIPTVALFQAKINELTTWLTRRVNLPILPG